MKDLILKDGQNIALASNRKLFDQYLHDIAKYKPLSREEEVELFKKIADSNDEEAIDKIFKHNLLFVVSVAKRYANLAQRSALTLEDLINEGNIGLNMAIRRFDHTKGFKFISYAVWWIRQSIMSSVQNNFKTIRLPESVRTIINKVSKYERYLEQKLKKSPSNFEIFEGMLADGILEKFQPDDFVKFDNMLNMNRTELRLNSKVNDDSLIEMQDLLKSDSESPEQELITKERNALLFEMIDKLPNNAKNYINDYFGLNGVTPMTLEAMSEKYDESVERIRQTIAVNIRKIKVNNRGKGKFFFPTPDYELVNRKKNDKKWDLNTIYLD